ncbi:MAG: methylenetetrahydrofolate reductase [NAD(P)H] [Alphaproteobacteria bacterium]
MTAPRVSFEFFPPHSEAEAAKLWETIRKLESLRPQFVSVTYGAGGSTRERTDRIVRRIKSETPLTPAAHLTCVGASCLDIDHLAQEWWNAGITSIVALRGDPPAGELKYTPHPEGYINAAALVRGLSKIANFDISVAAYPEKHPDSPTITADIDNLKHKFDNGARRGITQFFFEADTFLRFRDTCTAAGISAPIIPGILPVTNFAKIVQFAARCGTTVPNWMADLFHGLEDDHETRALVAASIATELCQKLAREGVEDFHFYTLNRPALTYAICRRLGVQPVSAEAA